MIHQVAYDSTGKIRFSSSSVELMDLSKISPALSILQIDAPLDPNGHYVSGDVVVERPVLPQFNTLELASGQQATLTGLPSPTTVTVNGISHQVTDGEVILPWAGAGRFNVLVQVWPYSDYAAVIECV
jgi:hypothetical protein